MKKYIYLSFITFLFTAISCNRGPKIVPLTDEDLISKPSGNSGIFSEDPPFREAGLLNDDIHRVMVNEILPTEKYVYLNVSEGDKTFWIATLKTEVQVGEYYIYKGSVLQSNFKSTEYNRTFEEVYFVSEIILANHGTEEFVDKGLSERQNAGASDPKPGKNIVVEGSVRIADLVSDPEKYGGENIQISGECVKVNAEIMGRNWIHLRDGSQDNFDLVVTSDDVVTEGQIVTMTGIVGLDRDFGGGYSYEIIIEGGKIVN